MKFGVFDHIDDSGLAVGQQFEERLALVERYEEAGFHAYHLAEHHGSYARRSLRRRDNSAFSPSGPLSRRARRQELELGARRAPLRVGSTEGMTLAISARGRSLSSRPSAEASSLVPTPARRVEFLAGSR